MMLKLQSPAYLTRALGTLHNTPSQSKPCPLLTSPSRVAVKVTGTPLPAATLQVNVAVLVPASQVGVGLQGLVTPCAVEALTSPGTRSAPTSWTGTLMVTGPVAGLHCDLSNAAATLTA